jgi:hypothetical protein
VSSMILLLSRISNYRFHTLTVISSRRSNTLSSHYFLKTNMSYYILLFKYFKYISTIMHNVFLHQQRIKDHKKLVEYL